MTPMQGILPAVTCSAQSTMLTGLMPDEHGIVANGWYFRDLAEVWLWRQSNRLVAGEKVWEVAQRRNPAFTACNMFWWYNMYSTVDASLTPRPLYFADGLKLPGVYGRPPEFRRAFEDPRNPFPLFQFWGPGAGIRSSTWIAQASIRAMDMLDPTLLMVYIPHLDYNLQRLGPKDPAIRQDLRELDTCVAPLLDRARENHREIIVVSEYGISDVHHPVHINRVLREGGFLKVQPQLDRENLDPGASRAFAVADHQIAHVYVDNPADMASVRRLLEGTPGIDLVLDREAQQQYHLAHERSGELVCIAEPEAWFTYYFWFDDHLAPDYARTVDIHRKPGYDPVELFADPTLSMLKARIALKVLRKKLGFRMVMDVIPLDAGLVKGSHGRLEDTPERGPLLITSSAPQRTRPRHLKDVKDLVLQTVFGDGSSN